MLSKFMRSLGLVFAVILSLAAGTARAQFNASLSGTVLDSTQAVIPGATVTLTDDATKAMKTAKSGSSGTFQFSELPAGTYSLSVTAKGFEQNVISNVVIAAETPRNLNVTLQIGQETQTVTVDATSTATLQTSDASIGSTISSEEINRLPIFGSDPYELLRTAPGIIGDGARAGSGNAVFLPNGAGPGGSNSSIFQTENQVQISADGQRVGANNFMVDGVSVNSLTHAGAAVVTPNQEAVGSITVVATSYDATNARFTGAQIQSVTKSGTNMFHGSAFFLYDNPGFNFFNTYGTGPGTPPVRNDNANRNWAASLGGPIVKDKLFFFLSYQEFKDQNPSFVSQYVLTPQFRAAIAANRGGGVSETILAQGSSNPKIVAVSPTPANACNGFQTYNTGPAVGGVTPTASTCHVVTGGIDIGSLTPGGTTQLGVFPSTSPIPGSPIIGGTAYGPTAQQVGGGFDGVPDLEYAQVEVPNQARGNQYNARVDYQMTHKDLIAGSIYFTKLSTVGATGTAPASLQSSTIFKPLNSPER